MTDRPRAREPSGAVPRRWLRRGRVFPLDRTATPSWMTTYAALPFPLLEADGSRVRVYFSGRDPGDRASIGAMTVDLGTGRAVPGSSSREPLLRPGVLGAFDDSGVTLSCVVPHQGRLHMYYTGWMLGRTVPFYFAVGLAVSDDGGRTFERLSEAPILDRHPTDPYLCASPSVLIEDGLWRMWYISGERWEARREGPRHYYLVRYAESDDGVVWRRDGRVVLGFAGSEEHAIGRPHVVKVDDGYRMWFCSRGDRYRLGVARSADGLEWRREPDGVVLEPSPETDAWDGEMQAYPAILRHLDRWWMFYNGNGYGATGFGIAEGRDEPERARE